MENKVAFITGAGSVGDGIGNGRAAALLFAREGASVFATDINNDAVRVTCEAIRAEGNRCEAVDCDVTSSADIKRAVETCVSRFGRIDVLHNNVGGSAPGDPVSMPEETWSAQIAMNLTSVFLTCKHVLPVMLAVGAGSIVNVSSVAGVRYLGHDLIAYAAAKSALMKFSQGVAARYARDNIRSNCVIPGLMHTPLVEVRLAQQYAGGDASALIARRNAQVPMGRMGDCWDIAYAALYLASDEAKYVTGAEILVDGGLTAKC
ncbi:SDR family oxidoreductase [Mesorhizobium sp. B2-4-13]|uniref:SDR family NAD(P)-dependent oxidoreductase n=1 Tax=Mesorhizobium sp. B2-4-13 TaxID=2589936 RepID=UPI0032B15BF9